jgi:Co/Zn/Cd efflux system component
LTQPAATAAEPAPSPAAPLDEFRSDRVYLGADHARNERRTWIVAVICLAALATLLGGGLVFRSMALAAAGLHMGAHVAALLTAAIAYAFARRRAKDARFSFGTGKVGYLAGFANAVVLAVTALAIAGESVERLFHPEAVDFHGAVPLAAGGWWTCTSGAWAPATTRRWRWWPLRRRKVRPPTGRGWRTWPGFPM